MKIKVIKGGQSKSSAETTSPPLARAANREVARAVSGWVHEYEEQRRLALGHALRCLSEMTPRDPSLRPGTT